MAVAECVGGGHVGGPIQEGVNAQASHSTPPSFSQKPKQIMPVDLWRAIRSHE